MLVMRRRAGECILIGPDIQVEILEVSPTRVKLGIVAPAALSILRREIVLTRDENLTAARTDPKQAIGWLRKRLTPAPAAGEGDAACQKLDDGILMPGTKKP